MISMYQSTTPALISRTSRQVPSCPSLATADHVEYELYTVPCQLLGCCTLVKIVQFGYHICFTHSAVNLKITWQVAQALNLPS